MGERDALVFADLHTAGPLDKAAILRRFRRALKAAQLEQSHRFHDLRHTFGAAMAGTGVAMWMGHRDIETTQRYADTLRARTSRHLWRRLLGRAPLLGLSPSGQHDVGSDLLVRISSRRGLFQEVAEHLSEW